MKKLFIAAAVIVMAGSMASCGQKTQKAAQDTAATEQKRGSSNCLAKTQVSAKPKGEV